VAGVRGDRALAMATFRDAESTLTALGVDDLLAVVQLGRGLAALTAGRPNDAYDALDRVFDPADPAWHELESFAAVGLWADAAIQAGQRAAALETLERIEAMGRRTGAPILHAGLRHARAVFADDDAVAPGLFTVAIDGADAWPFQQARSRLAFGAWLRRRRRIVDSRRPLRLARDGFEGLGLDAWAEQARRELRASGERSQRRTATPRAALSAQERQIAVLAADGLSNEQIAERLFLSPRTVGSHLYRAFPKLGIASRAELRDALGGGAPIPEVGDKPEPD
jgi:DNA-binding CsgD family transcriptional regulator